MRLFDDSAGHRPKQKRQSSRAAGVLRDIETGSLWQVLTGQAVDGPLFGQRLERLPSHYSFWFAWSDFHPATELYQSGTG